MRTLKVGAISLIASLTLVACGTSTPLPDPVEEQVVSMVVPHNIPRSFTEADAARTIELLYQSLFTINPTALNNEIEKQVADKGITEEQGDEGYIEILNILKEQLIPAPFTYIELQLDEETQSTPILDFLFWGTLINSNSQDFYKEIIDETIYTIKVAPEDITLHPETMTATHNMDTVTLINKNGETVLTLNNTTKDEQAYSGKLKYKNSTWYLIFDMTNSPELMK